MFARAKSGDKGARDLLLAAVKRRAMFQIQASLGKSLQAHYSSDDLWQDVAFKILRDIQKCEWRGEAAFSAWVRTLTHRIITSLIRHFRTEMRDQRKTEPLGDHDPTHDDGPEKQLLRSELNDRVVEILAEFPADIVQVFLAVKLDDEPMSKAAAAAGITYSTAVRRVAKIITKLASELGNDYRDKD